ncbi:MAG: DUF29 domain-containing protein [Cyanobacteria bacterium QS_8_64_29]|nr:MAG: DUF29 domain-containing protein [Cyanobacteria bacterium QS_8_64_29]
MRPTQDLAQLYQTDYLRWLDETIVRLCDGAYDALDCANLIEELADMGRSEKRALESNLRVVLQHLLKWHCQPEQRTGSWRATIREHRRRIRRQLTDSPSLRLHLQAQFEDEYAIARQLAADETELPLERFPASPPFAPEQAIDENFWPSAAAPNGT